LFGCSGFAPAKWEKVTESTNPHVTPFLSVFFFDSSDGIAITPGSLQRTNNGGKSWTPLISEDSEKAFHALTFTTPSTGFVVGLQKKTNGYAPMILRTEDGARTWQESLINVPTRTTDVKPRLQSVGFCDQHIGWATGSDLIVHTGNGGQTWETQRLGIDEGLFGIACLSSERAVAVGQAGA
jgi:photosystem II stability/assembly factor-like uncharacterized protein